MKNQNFQEEAKHLEGVKKLMEDKITFEEKRLQERDLDITRQDTIQYGIQQLERQKESPYFGRIDVQFGKDEKVEKMYIGPATFFDEEDQVQVYDWRAPIASLFYEGTLGELHYETPNGAQKAQAFLKRDIVIKKGTLQSVYDIENEESLLMEALSAPTNKDGYLEGITATIQKEQNEIIRLNPKDWLIVNGCAGSGKTTILLQRIAYLMYQAKDKRMSDMLLLSRNQLFAKYVSHVIPSLTGSELYQQTLAQHTIELYRKMYLHKTTTLSQVPTRKVYLTDSEWIALVHRNLQGLTAKDLPYRAIGIKGQAVFTMKDYEKLTENVNVTLPLHQQLTQMQTVLERTLKRRLNKFFMSEKAKAVYESMNAMQIEVLMKDVETKSEAEYFQVLGQKVFEKEVLEVTQQVEMFAFVDIAYLVQQWMPQAKARRQELEKMDNAPIPLKKIEGARLQVTAEGIRLLQYVATRVTPVRDYVGYSHLFIDEVQDVSLLWLGTLSNFYFRAKFTVVGDTYQSFTTSSTIFTLGTRHPELVELVFPNRTLTNRSLEISYRCTAQITRFANGILQWPLDKNVFPRTGSEVTLYSDADGMQLTRLKGLLEESPQVYHTTAILCRTMEEAKALHQLLNVEDIALLEDSSESLGSRFVLTTIQVAKGMEFDEVIIWNATDEAYHTAKEQMMLYTTCTRAKHRLSLIVPKGTENRFIQTSQAPMKRVEQ
ncbi:UvrD-helicase domain-containing protein [uncultured Granulicatella sp.]|uniref:HelD family protein n=1 Tax=uncultured Granulicatella sp. TaxID=316089 RepID=UPI0028060EBA|nr:UvrD-helicase domain-containing protein [uncultured Granulicatella sp.]